MSAPLGSVLGGVFKFFKNEVLADPTPAPTIVTCTKPDGTVVTPPALVHLGTGLYYAAQIFSATDTATLTGFYNAVATTTDGTIDNPKWDVTWEVEAAIGSVDVASFSNGAQTDIDAILAAVQNSNIVHVEGADPQTGATTLVRGSSYMATDVPSRALRYTIIGYPTCTLGDPAYWRAIRQNPGGVEQVTGEVVAISPDVIVEFSIPASVTSVLTSGGYSIALDSAHANPLKTANQTLTIQESN